MVDKLPAIKSFSPEVGAKGGRAWLVLAGCFMLLAVLGWLDYLTGYELGFFVFYSVPVGIAAWYVGRWPAVSTALGATLAWLLADYYSGAKYSARFYYYWNSTVHFLAFVINAVTIAKIKTDLDRRKELAAELDAARRQLEVLTAQLPTCSRCGKPLQAAIEYPELSRPTPARTAAPTDTLCDECRNLNSGIRAIG